MQLQIHSLLVIVKFDIELLISAFIFTVYIVTNLQNLAMETVNSVTCYSVDRQPPFS